MHVSICFPSRVCVSERDDVITPGKRGGTHVSTCSGMCPAIDNQYRLPAADAHRQQARP